MANSLCPIVVGRDLELAALTRALDAALDGSGGVVLITGEAGIGKSRLAAETVAAARQRDAVGVTGRAVPSGAASPYLPMTEALLQALRDRSVPDDADFAAWRPLLGAVLPTLVGSSAAEATPTARSEAIVQLLRRLADSRGLVIALEDVHWADPDTLALLGYLADNLAGAHVLCLATSRDEPVRPELVRMLANRTATHLPLTRLADAAAAEMVRACAPEADDAAVRRVLQVADGVPFLVEEVLVSPGVPASLAETVHMRLAEFDERTRSVLSTAAVLGRTFDWQLLGASCGQPADIVDRALEQGLAGQLLRVEGGVFAFRHALSRQAILDRLLPQRRRAIAAAALAALDADPGRADRELAADLAAQAGNDARAGALLTESGRAALARGALATAIDTLRRAHALGDAGAALPLVRALALAGHVDETVAVGERAAASSSPPSERLAIELEIAHAAVAAARWQLAKEHIERARALAADDADADARLAVLEAEVALAADDTDRAAALVSPIVDSGVAAPIRCQAWEIRGRVARFTDHLTARECFEQARVLAERTQLPFWRLRALHELGTIAMFESADADLLLQSRAAAQELGAPGLVAVLDLQLTAVYHCRFELASANEHARSALRLSDQLGLDLARTKALVMLAENASWRGDRAEFDEFSGRTRAASNDPAIAAFLTGGRAMYELLYGDRARAVDAFHRAARMLDGLPHAEPAAFRAMAPVVLAAAGDMRATELLAAARRSGVGSFGMNRGLLDGAAAILAGRGGNAGAARRWIAESAADFANCTAWSELVRWLAAESAAAERWDQPGWWADGVAARLAARGLVRPADRCRALTDGPQRWAVPGITTREADVLSLLVAGLSNRDIALQLHVSPRTVEKHVEALLRKLDVRSRTQLVSAALRQATT